MMSQPKVGAAQSSPTLPTPAHGVRWTTPIVETPGIVVLGSWIYRLVRLVVMLPFRFPVMVASAVVCTGVWWHWSWPGLLTFAGGLSMAAFVWRRRWPESFSYCVTLRLLAWWRHLSVYYRDW